MMKNCSVFLMEQKMEFEKFNCFFVDFLGCSFGRISYVDRGWKRVYTRHNPTYLFYISTDWFLYDKRFYWTVFPITIFTLYLQSYYICDVTVTVLSKNTNPPLKRTSSYVFRCSDISKIFPFSSNWICWHFYTTICVWHFMLRSPKSSCKASSVVFT